MQLSDRLQAVVDLVTPGNRVADVGCDHAYTSIYLVENKISPNVIAMDINQGPIDRAKENIRKYGYEDKITTRKSDGLEKLRSGEVDTVLIAGMGGGLTVQILTRHRDRMVGLKELVLSPQSEIHLVRELLERIGFIITKENMIKEEGKYYVMMKAEANKSVMDKEAYKLLCKEHVYFGRLLLESKHPILREYLLKEEKRCINILETLQREASESTQARKQEMEKILELIDAALGYYNG
ncbi:MAG: SAM-dependent methyltransferase [Clostridiales bacterium]|nr:SAM-dependent methyltransferase [Clostridiales bacterium]